MPVPRREGLAVFVVEDGKRVGVISVIEHGKFRVIHGVNAVPFMPNRSSVESLRRLVAELPGDLQSVVRDYAGNTESTLTQDDDACAFMIRAISIPKSEVPNSHHLHHLDCQSIGKVHPLQAPHIAVLKKAFRL